jgi:hypothetical protein
MGIKEAWALRRDKNYIICGFSGVGKSSAENKCRYVIDYESSSFSHTWVQGHFSPIKNKEFPVNYIDAVLERYSDHTGEVYLISCHQEVRDELKRRGVDYIIVMPTVHQKNEYLKRWLRRGSTTDFIVSMEKRWHKMIRSCENDDAPKIYLDENEYISDVLPMI